MKKNRKFKREVEDTKSILCVGVYGILISLYSWYYFIIGINVGQSLVNLFSGIFGGVVGIFATIFYFQEREVYYKEVVENE